MADDLHSFITGTLRQTLEADVRDFRVFNRSDLSCAAYFHIRRVLFTQPGWSCRADPPISREQRPPLPDPDLAILSNGRLNALLQFEFHVTPGMASGFPTAVMNERMTFLRRAVEQSEQPRAAGSARIGRGYLVAVYDTEEEWFYPDQLAWDQQSCFWLPVNCRTFADYSEWHQQWDRAARISSH
jgi:hypothetical protein